MTPKKATIKRDPLLIVAISGPTATTHADKRCQTRFVHVKEIIITLVRYAAVSPAGPTTGINSNRIEGACGDVDLAWGQDLHAGPCRADTHLP